MTKTAPRIAEINDRLRTNFAGGRIVITASLNPLPAETLARIFAAVKAFEAFTPDNDPYQEHDFGALHVDGHAIFFKIDCYQAGSGLTEGAEHPEDPATTDRVLTIMLAEDY